MTPEELLAAATPKQQLILETIKLHPHDSNEAIGGRLGMERRTIDAQLHFYYKRVPELLAINSRVRRQVLTEWLRGYQENQ